MHGGRINVLYPRVPVGRTHALLIRDRAIQSFPSFLFQHQYKNVTSVQELDIKENLIR